MTVLTVSGTALTYYATSGARASAHSRGGQNAYTLAEADATIAYVNMVGAQDELVYDGDSFIVAPDGTVTWVLGQALADKGARNTLLSWHSPRDRSRKR